MIGPVPFGNNFWLKRKISSTMQPSPTATSSISNLEQLESDDLMILDLSPLTDTLSKLSTNHNEFKAPKRRTRSKSLGLGFDQTPSMSASLVKPLQNVFHSTGVLSKKSRSQAIITPDTPLKHKRVLASVWGESDSKPHQMIGTPIPKSISRTSAIYSNASNVRSKPGVVFGVSALKPPMPFSFISPFGPASNSKTAAFTATTTPSNPKPNRPRSPAETPTKVNKRPHISPTTSNINSSPLNPNFSPLSYQNSQPPCHFTTPDIDQSTDRIQKLYTFDSPNTSSVLEKSNAADKYILSATASPVVPAKVFFSRLVKERRVPTVPLLPFSSLISHHKHTIDRIFFDALDGKQPGLDLTLSTFKNRSGDTIPNNRKNSKASNASAMMSVNSDRSEGLEDWFESQFELVGRLGSGEFADAFRVRSLQDDQDYAIKKTRNPFSGYKDA